MRKAFLKNLAPLAPLAALVSALACSGRVTNQSVSVIPQRGGYPLAFVDTKYTDDRPQISFDGTKIAFRSGRDSIEGKGETFKIYKSPWPATGTPPTVTRATKTELGIEQDFAMSPDGKWLAIQVMETSGQVATYLQDYAGAAAAVKIPDETTAKANLTFSSDSLLLAWIDLTGQPATSSSAHVVAIGAGAAADVASPVAVAAAGQGVKQVFWGPAASGYNLVAASEVSAIDDDHWNYNGFTFATAAAAASAASAPFLKAPILKVPDYLPVTAGGVTLMTQGINAAADPNSPAYTPVLGVPNTAANVQVQYTYVVKEVGFVQNGALTTYQPTQPGYDFKGAALSSDGSTAFLLARNVYLCIPDADYYYGSSFSVVGTTPGALPTAYGVPRLVPYNVVSGNPISFDFTLAHDFCDRPLEVIPGAAKDAPDVYQRLDDRAEAFAVSGKSTASVYRLVYVSRFSLHFDGTCQLKSANPQIYVLDVNGATSTITALSNNTPPLAEYYDDDRGGYAPCVL